MCVVSCCCGCSSCSSSVDEARVFGQVLRDSARAIGVFLFFVLLLQVMLVYRAIVTMTTFGYGDVVP